MKSQEVQSPGTIWALADKAQSSATSCWGPPGLAERPTQGPRPLRVTLHGSMARPQAPWTGGPIKG